ncbi:cell division protein [Clostridium botulinum]|uniref:Cell division protein n=1 Tax=Clostridium botulinum TaxID=1491 RepID=A0AA44BRE8_CLOBO|nr:cell division protein [Clostridium botulinum]NFI23453.1 cell division protein [Clostridium botulinum]NFQ80296.1 cell division protein [Clostridium botulinum]
MRKLENVIEEVISVSENKDFNNELLNIKNSISLTAPELMSTRWNQVHEIMLDYTIANNEKPQYDWQYEVISIFSTKSIDELKSIFN